MEEQKRNFSIWMERNGFQLLSDKTLELLHNLLLQIGIKGSLFEEKDVIKIRLIISDFAIKRQLPGLGAFQEYLKVLQILICYAEFLESHEDYALVSQQRDIRKDSLTVAYYLSKNNKDALRTLGYKNYSAAFKGLGRVLGQKETTIKNMRDEFDPYFDNGRVGWYQRSLKRSRLEIFELYKEKTDYELEQDVKEIVSYYQGLNTSKAVNGHKKLTISNTGMKEIRSKHK